MCFYVLWFILSVIFARTVWDTFKSIFSSKNVITTWKQ